MPPKIVKNIPQDKQLKVVDEVAPENEKGKEKVNDSPPFEKAVSRKQRQRKPKLEQADPVVEEAPQEEPPQAAPVPLPPQPPAAQEDPSPSVVPKAKAKKVRIKQEPLVELIHEMEIPIHLYERDPESLNDPWEESKRLRAQSDHLREEPEMDILDWTVLLVNAVYLGRFIYRML